MHKKRGVLLVTGGYYPEINGGGLQVRLIKNNLSNKFKAYVISFSNKIESSISDFFYKKSIIRIIIKKNIFNTLLAVLKIILYFAIYSNKINIIHFRGYSRKVILICILNIILNKKIIYAPTSYLHDDLESLKKKLNPIIFKFFINSVNCYIFMSPILLNSSKKFIKNVPSHVIQNMVNINQYSYVLRKSKETINILTIGFLSEIKNSYLTYQVFKKLIKDGYNLSLTYVGKKKFDYYLSDNTYEKIIKNAKNHNLLNKINFIFETAEPEVYLHRADIFIFPSKTEGLANVILEAMSTGLPTVIHNINNLSEFIVENEKDGLIVRNNNLESYYKCIKKILDSPTVRKNLSINARKKVLKKFAVGVVMPEIENIYDKI